MDDVPDWETLNQALKFLFTKYEFDFNEIGQTQRLEYGHMETILYHLSMIMDPIGCRRVFRLLFPARNQDERAKFINEMVVFINKRLHPDKISSSRLRMCGGAPFRRLLGTLITKAADAEISATLRRSICDQPVDADNGHPWDILDEERKCLRERLYLLEDKRNRYQSLLDALQSKHLEAADLWNKLKSDLESQQMDFSPGKRISLNELDTSSLKLINKLLIDRIEKSSINSKNATDRLLSIELPVTNDDDESVNANVEKRLSYYVRELREKLTSSDDPKSLKTVDRINHQLREYDNEVMVLLTKLEERQIDEDDAFLKIPEVAERYRMFDELMPNIDIEPFEFEQPLQCPDITKVKDILEKFYKSPYDIEEIYKLLQISLAY